LFGKQEMMSLCKYFAEFDGCAASDLPSHEVLEIKLWTKINHFTTSEWSESSVFYFHTKKYNLIHIFRSYEWPLQVHVHNMQNINSI
jgi:hypothetical protein